MAPKITNRKLTRLLFFLSRTFDAPIWYGFHETIRRLELLAVAPFLTWLFRREFPTDRFRIFARHSVEEPGAFNVFLSDFDFSVVFDEEPSIEELGRVLRVFRRISSRLSFLGEMEIYTKSEFELLRTVKARYGKVLDFIWNLRKWSWQIKSLNGGCSEYHRYKAERSIGRLRRKLGPAVSGEGLVLTPDGFGRLVTSEVSKMFSEAASRSVSHISPFSGRSGYLFWEFRDVHPLFAGIIPDADWIFPGRKGEIDEIRKIPEVGHILSAVSAAELLLYRTSRRVLSVEEDSNWAAHLARIIETYGPASSLIDDLEVVSDSWLL